METEQKHVRGFTLVEVLVTTLVMALISGAVFSSFLYFTKGAINVGHYADLDRQARLALHTFGSDVRMAQSVTWTSDTHVTLVVPMNNSGGSYTVVYRWLDEAFSTQSLRETFSRQVTASANTALIPTDASPQMLISGVARDKPSDPAPLRFTRYRLNSPTSSASVAPTATNDYDTKQINIRFEARRKTQLVARASNVILSARYVLRNKVITN